jgi:hypothetical protein
MTPEKRTNMPFLIAHAIQHNPEQQNACSNNRQSVEFKESLVFTLTNGKLQKVSPQSRPET